MPNVKGERSQREWPQLVNVMGLWTGPPHASRLSETGARRERVFRDKTGQKLWIQGGLVQRHTDPENLTHTLTQAGRGHMLPSLQSKAAVCVWTICCVIEQINFMQKWENREETGSAQVWLSLCVCVCVCPDDRLKTTQTSTHTHE